ncbi:putative ORFan [Tupanvirus deep ocean]|uniref:ORFan n=2 Tax=Tupanvirus TaxID=2094720 RepID=A0AC62A710_9VIRU|nr:putative ORFan [Tupanvirus deep ocean]QKU33463.1 putative ORFan [Tupanvirus deep ocean]
MMNKYFTLLFQILLIFSASFVSMTSIFMAGLYTKLIFSMMMLLHIFVPIDKSVFMLNSCSHYSDNVLNDNNMLNYLPIGYYIGLALINFYYYLTPMSVILECAIVVYLAGSALYIYYLISTSEKYSYNFNDEYVYYYRRMEAKRKNICKNAYQVILITIIFDILLNFDYASIIYLMLKIIFKMLMVAHCYLQYNIEATLKRKKLF